MLRGVIFDVNGIVPTPEITYRDLLLHNLKTAGLQVTDTASSGFTIPGLAPEQCLVITDSKAGTLTAKNAQIPCIGYTASDTANQNLSLAYALLESLESADADYLCRTHAHALSYPAQILTTHRLLVREFSKDDFPVLYAMCTHPETALFMEESLSDYAVEEEKHIAYLQNIYPFFDLALWGIYEKSSGTLIGRGGFSLPEDDDYTFSLGYLIDIPYRRQGYAKELVPALLSYAKEQGYPEVSAKIKPNNLASKRVLEQCGFPFTFTNNQETGVFTYTICLTN